MQMNMMFFLCLFQVNQKCKHIISSLSANSADSQVFPRKELLKAIKAFMAYLFGNEVVENRKTDLF